MKNSQTTSISEYCAGLSELSKKYPKPTSIARSKASELVAVLDEFMECVRYLNTRRASGAILRLEDEAAVQDALYLMLRPWIRDLTPEDPNGRIGNRYTIKDFLSKKLRVVLEAKFIRDRDHGKSITKELHDDIESYRHSPHCDDLIFFVFDPDNHIPDVQSLKTTIQCGRNYDGRILRVTLVVKP